MFARTVCLASALCLSSTALAQDVLEDDTCPAGGGLVLDAPSLGAKAIEVGFKGDAYVSVLDDGLAVTGGRTVLTGFRGASIQGTLELADSRVVGGDAFSGVVFGGKGAFVADAGSRFVVEGGNIEYHDNRIVSFSDDSSLRIDGGDVVFTGSSTSTLSDSTFRIGGGNWTFDDHATIDSSNSRIRVEGGNFTASDNASFKTGGGIIRVTSGDLLISDYAQFSATGGSTLNISGGGNLELSRSASVQADDTTPGGSLLLLDNARVVVSGGSILGYDHSSILAHGGSTISVSGGSVLFADSARVSLSGESRLVPSEGSVLTLKPGSGLELDRSSRLAARGGLETPDPTFTADDVRLLQRACETSVRLYATEKGLTATCTKAKPASTCSGFLEAKRGEPQWECEDTCLKDKAGDYVCGDTDHF